MSIKLKIFFGLLVVNFILALSVLRIWITFVYTEAGGLGDDITPLILLFFGAPIGALLIIGVQVFWFLYKKEKVGVSSAKKQSLLLGPLLILIGLVIIYGVPVSYD